jgi:flagellar basal-body rod protein FlgB
MAFTIDDILGLHPQALRLQARRSELLAGNLANADTPNYKARDLDFRQALAEAGSTTLRLTATRQGHQSAPPAGVGGQPLYRVPHQPSLDGNSVETEVEQAQFARNALRYQASLRFIDGKFRTLITAIRGE